MLLALSTVSSKNVCRATIHTDGAAEQAQMQNAALLSFHWNWLQLVLLCVIVPTTNYIVDATQTRRRRKKCQFPVKEIHSNLLFSFSDLWGYSKCCCFFFFLLNSIGFFLASVVKGDARYSTLNSLLYCTDYFFLSEQFSSQKVCQITNNFVLLSCWLIVSPGLFKSVSRCLSPILE